MLTKVKLTNNTPVEDDILVKVEHIYYFKSSFFDGCKTDEERAERFEEGFRTDISYDEIDMEEVRK